MLCVVISRYDRLLIYDVLISMCALILAPDFFHLIEYFHLVKYVTGSTHVKNHNLDLVSSFGLSLNNFALHDICMSEHKVISIDTELPLPTTKLPAATRCVIGGLWLCF